MSAAFSYIFGYKALINLFKSQQWHLEPLIRMHASLVLKNFGFSGVQTPWPKIFRHFVSPWFFKYFLYMHVVILKN